MWHAYFWYFLNMYRMRRMTTVSNATQQQETEIPPFSCILHDWWCLIARRFLLFLYSMKNHLSRLSKLWNPYVTLYVVKHFDYEIRRFKLVTDSCLNVITLINASECLWLGAEIKFGKKHVRFEKDFAVFV